MKKFFRTRFGKRVLVGLILLLAAVLCGFALRGFVGPETELWQRGVFCVAALGTGLAGFLYVFGDWPGLLCGYAVVLSSFLPKALPERWKGLAAIGYFAVLGCLVMFVRLRGKRKAESDEAPGEETDEESEEGEFLPNGPVIVHFYGSDRNYQLIRTPGELRAYRVGGELRGVELSLLQDPEKPLRPLGKRDLSFPLDGTFRLTLETKRNNKTDEEELVVTLCSGSKRHRMNALTPEPEFRALLERCTANRTEKPSRIPKDPRKTPNAARVHTLRGVSIALSSLALVIGLPWLFLDVPYRLFAGLILLLSPAVLVVCCLFPDDTTLRETKRDERERASFLMPLALSAFIPGLRSLMDFNILNWPRLLIFTGVLFVVLTAVFLLRTTEWRARKVVLINLILLLFFALGAMTEVNYIFDSSEPVVREAVVEDRHVSSGSKSPDTYTLKVRMPDGGMLELNVDEAYYNTTEVGSSVSVYTYSGALGVPYAFAR